MPFPGVSLPSYPDYTNHGDAPYDGNQYAFASGDTEGVLFTAGSSATFALPVKVQLESAAIAGVIYTGDPLVLDPAPDIYDVADYTNPAKWTPVLTWTVTRYTLDGLIGLRSPAEPSPTGTVVATQDAPNGWTAALTTDDLTPYLTTIYTPYTAATVPGSLAFTAPGDAPYGVYRFAFQAVYQQTLYTYGGEAVAVQEVAFHPDTPPPGLIRTGAATLTLTNDPDFPAPGTLSGGSGSYSISGTGPVYSPTAPRGPTQLIDVKLTLAGMPTETNYLGPKLVTVVIKHPTAPGAPTDLASYIAAHPYPYDGEAYSSAFPAFGSVLLPESPPDGTAGEYKWKMPWPFYAGSYTIYFVPVSAWGPYYDYPAQPGDVSLAGALSGDTAALTAPSPARDYTYLVSLGLVPNFTGQLDVTITPWGSGGGGSSSGPVGDGGDAAQDTATGRVTQVGTTTTGTGGTATHTLTAEAHEGWQNLSGTPPRPSASILDASGNPAQGQYPSLWKVSDEGRYSLCYLAPYGAIVRGESLDGLSTLMPFPPIIFLTSAGTPRTGGRPCHIQDTSTGIYYVAASFTNVDSSGTPTGTEDVLIARVDGQDALLTWSDGTTQKAVVLGTTAAGRPALVQNRYDPEQPLLLLHGDRKFAGTLGGEQWTEIT